MRKSTNANILPSEEASKGFTLLCSDQIHLALEPTKQQGTCARTNFCEGLCESSALEEPHNLPLGRDITIFSNSEEMTLFQGAEENSKIEMFSWKS